MNYGASGEHTMQLDRTDTKIPRALQEDARRSFRELARRVGVSVPTVSAHVANLERLGVLSGYHATIDPEKLRLKYLHPDYKALRETVQKALESDPAPAAASTTPTTPSTKCSGCVPSTASITPSSGEVATARSPSPTTSAAW